MLIIRLSRRGKIKEPKCRIIISEKTKDTKGDYLESLGFYNPTTKEISLNEERIKYWLSKGAQLSATINNLLISKNIITGKKINKAGKAKKKEEAGRTEEQKEGAPAGGKEKPAPEAEGKDESGPAEVSPGKEAEKTEGPKPEEKK